MILHLGDEQQQAIKAGKPVVALESTIISHGLPWPQNYELATELEHIIRAQGAIPATIAVISGKLTIGISDAQISQMAQQGKAAIKLSRRDLPTSIALGLNGSTTVAATMMAAHMAGIRIFATGGIGGVHRGGQDSLDVSADLYELGRTKIAVVCAGAKSILDLPRTLEILESQGVPVFGYGCDQFPAFHCISSGLPVDWRVDDVDTIANILKMRDRFEAEKSMLGGELITIPIPAADAIEYGVMQGFINQALRMAQDDGISGKAITPYLLEKLAILSDQRSIAANLALIRNNAKLAAKLAVCYHQA